MTLPLQLEYICTDAEMREAQSLNLRRQLGKGSRARTLLTLFGFLSVLLVALYFRIRTEVAPKYQPYFLAAVAVIFVFFFFKQRRSRKNSDKPTRVEVSHREVVFENNGARASVLWSGFSQCLESHNLFVLLDQPKGLMLIFPKRVFPDEAAQNWFRLQANQRPNAAASTADMPTPSCPPLPGDGIALNFQLGFRDYLNRTMVSWRTKGILLLVFVVITVACLYEAAHPPPDAVNSPAKVYFVFMLPFMTVMMAVIVPGVAFMAWRMDKKYLGPRQIVLGNERIEFASVLESGHLPWTAFKYWLENRWCFLVWHPGGPKWEMLPKRAFASATERDRCRDLLRQRLRRSRWFFT